MILKIKNDKRDDLNIFVWPLCLVKEQVEKKRLGLRFIEFAVVKVGLSCKFGTGQGYDQLTMGFCMHVSSILSNSTIQALLGSTSWRKNIKENGRPQRVGYPRSLDISGSYSKKIF